MSNIFDNYTDALIDASFFTAYFSEEVKKGLKKINVHMAESVKDEIEQYSKILDKKKLDIYRANSNFLYDQKKHIASYDISEENSNTTNNDTWGILTILIKQNLKPILLTANQILIQKIIYHGLQIDIYDLNNNTLLRKEDFHNIKTHSMSSESNSMCWRGDELNSVYYTKDGTQYILGNNPLEENSNLYIFPIQDSNDYVAKIYKKELLCESLFTHLRQIEGMNKKMGIDWAFFPETILYYDKNCLYPAGFIEQNIMIKRTLSKNLVFSEEQIFSIDKDLLKTKDHVLQLCIYIVRQVYYLNVYGFLVSDYDLENLAIREDSQNRIQIKNAERFGYKDYFDTSTSPYFYSPNKNRKDKEAQIDLSTDALYQCIFTLISYGDTPFDMQTGQFKYDNSSYEMGYRKNFFGDELWKHMVDVFHGKKPASASVLLCKLHSERELLELKADKTNSTYKELFHEYKYGLQQASTTQYVKQDSIQQPKKTNKKYLLLIFIPFIVIALSLGFVVYKNNKDKTEPVNETVETVSRFEKDFSNYDWDTAKQEVEKEGFVAEKTEEYSWDHRKGTVISNDYNYDKMTATFSISKGPEASDVEDYGASLSVSSDSIKIDVGDNSTIDLTAYGNLPAADEYFFDYYGPTEELELKWEEWIGDNTCPVTIYGRSPWKGYIRFYIEDDVYNEYLAFVDVYVEIVA